MRLCSGERGHKIYTTNTRILDCKHQLTGSNNTQQMVSATELSLVPEKKKKNTQRFEYALCAPKTSIALMQLCNGPPFHRDGEGGEGKRDVAQGEKYKAKERRNCTSNGDKGEGKMGSG